MKNHYLLIDFLFLPSYLGRFILCLLNLIIFLPVLGKGKMSLWWYCYANLTVGAEFLLRFFIFFQ